MDLRAVVMRPNHGHLRDPVATLARNEKNLRVETPALDLLARKHSMRSLFGERLQPALRVAIRQPQQHPVHNVVQASCNLAKDRLPLRHRLRTRPARTDRYIRAGVDLRE